MREHLIDPIIKTALSEDISCGDMTTDHLIDSRFQSEMNFLLKEEGVISGLGIAERTFHLLNPGVKWESLVDEGELLSSGTVIAKVKGIRSRQVAPVSYHSSMLNSSRWRFPCSANRKQGPI